MLIWLEQVRRRLKMQSIKFDIFDNADDFAPGIVAVISNPFSKRVFVWPAATRECFVDDEDGRRIGGVMLSEDASFE